MNPSKGDRPLPRYREGQVFEGFAFGRPITVTLDYPEWIDYAGPHEFWSWHAKTQYGGGARLAEHILATEFQEVGS